MNTFRNTPGNLKSGFIEILLIFIGVTVAIAFGNWNDKRKEKTIEKNYLRLLSTEVNNNMLTLDHMITKYNNRIETLKRVLEKTGPAPVSIATNSFDSLLSLSLSSPNFELTNSATNELLNSGNGNVIRDIKLRVLITQWNNSYNQYNISDQKSTLNNLEQYIYSSGSLVNLDKTNSRFSYAKELRPVNYFKLDNRKLLKDPVFQNLIVDHLHTYIWYNDKYIGIKALLDNLSSSLKNSLSI
jgi:hypothetical protein